jgi:hypothetical protein
MKLQETDHPQGGGQVAMNAFSWVFFLATGALTVITGLKPGNRGIRKAVHIMSIIEAVLTGIGFVACAIAILGLSMLHALVEGTKHYHGNNAKKLEAQKSADLIASLRTYLSLQMICLVALFVLSVVIASFICCGKKQNRNQGAVVVQPIVQPMMQPMVVQTGTVQQNGVTYPM